MKRCSSTMTCEFPEAHLVVIVTCQRTGFLHRFFGHHLAFKKEVLPHMTLRAEWDRKSGKTEKPGDREGV